MAAGCASSPEPAKRPLTSEVRQLFDLVKAAAIVGIFNIHFYDISLGFSISVNKIQKLGVLRYLAAEAHGPLGYVLMLVKSLAAFGDIGVPLFVIASGFGIAYSHATRPRGWAEFYRRRFLRVIPLYYLALLVAAAVVTLIYKTDLYMTTPGLVRILCNMLFVSSFTNEYSIYAAFYFIGIIVQLYILFPVLIKLCRTRYLNYIFLAASFFLSPAINAAISHAGYSFRGILVTDYLPFFLFGMLMANSFISGGAMQRAFLDRRVSYAALAGLIAAAYLTSYQIDYHTAGKSAMSLTAFMCAPAFGGLFRSAWFGRAVKYISYGSYCIYLFHISVTKVALKFIGTAWGTSLAFTSVKYAAILAVTVLLSHLIQNTYDRALAKLGV